jgi:predicted ABC-type transport system involved in lysophospholipase L1 biosynthesis ATPase subunit
VATIIEIDNVHKVYDTGAMKVPALRGVSLNVLSGEFVAIMGASGSGKSTLMNIVGCLDRPTTGRYLLDGREVSRMSRDELAEIRNRTLGFVFQSFNLLTRTAPSRTWSCRCSTRASARASGCAARPKRSTASRSPIGSTTIRRSSRADSSSASPSPARSSANRK